MLELKKIILTHFKNYDLSSFDFDGRVTGICGLNGKGKTNLLDAIYYCCFTKSYFASSELRNINFSKDGFRLEGIFENNGQKQKLVCIHRGNRKEILLDDIAYEKFSQHIGLFPAVIIAPDDVEIIAGGSEGRRRFFDSLISQLDNEYLQKLIVYNKILQQRNSLLKQFADRMPIDSSLLEVIDQQLEGPANFIYARRLEAIGEITPMVQDFYHQLSSNSEAITLSYESNLHKDAIGLLLKKNLQRDIYLQRTSAGIHRDDLGFSLNGQPFKAIASQGQRKTLLFALKLAEYQVIKNHKGFPPLLLLDDVFEKLDELRMQQLLQWVCKENEGQVFITDTHRDRLEKAFAHLEVQGQIIEL